jgi:hypothetical protein
MNRSFRLVAVVLILVLVSLACGGGGSALKPTAEKATVASPTAEKATVASPTEPAQAPTATKAPAKTPTPGKSSLGQEQRSEEGGFAFRPITGYKVASDAGVVNMAPPDADPNIGPVFLLAGTAAENGTTNEKLMQSLSQQSDMKVSEPKEIKVAGVAGLAADITTTQEGKDIKGRVVVAMVSSTHQFTLLGAATSDLWDREVQALFEQVLASVSFFEPTVKATEPAPTPAGKPTGEATGETLRQWASSAAASSEYGNPDWAAKQATGKPNVSECGDDTSAWASADKDTEEWIELSFDQPVIPTEVNIYETFNPDQIVKVELVDVVSGYHEIYTNVPFAASQCPYILSIPVPFVDFTVSGIRITIDQSKIGNWNEIDAVELVGINQ